MPREPFIIREATTDDIPVIADIYRPEVETRLASWEEIPPSEWELTGRMEKIRAQGLPYLVAERYGRVLGYSYAAPFHPRSAYRYTLEDTVYIHPDAQGQGIGRSLLEDLIRRCEALGYRQMMALIHWTPKSVSVALHERLGFRLVGIAHGVGYKFGAWHDLAQLQRSLGSGSTTSPLPLFHRPQSFG
jgi:phosphinothricin acetyltransferase